MGDSGWRSRKKNMVISNVVKTSVSVANHMRMRIAHLISACILDRIRDSSGAGSWRPGRLLGLDQGQAKKKAGQATRRQRRDLHLELIVAVTVFLHERDRACMVEDQKKKTEYEQLSGRPHSSGASTPPAPSGSLSAMVAGM